MSKKEPIAWFTFGACAIGWMIWRDVHLPNCIAMYGGGTTEAQFEAWMACSQGNESQAFATQAIAILSLLGGMAVWVGIMMVLDLCSSMYKKWRNK